MSRRRSSTRKAPQPKPAAETCPAVTPNPPRPHKPLLIAAVLLDAVWISFLVVLVVLALAG